MNTTWTLLLEEKYIAACRLVGMSVGLANICLKQFGDIDVYSVSGGNVKLFLVGNNHVIASFSFPFRPDDEIVQELVKKYC